MPTKYSLDTKIEALNLLDQLDGDFRELASRLDIPLKTIRGWRSSEEELRQRFEDRQYRHFANLKLTLLKDMLETSCDIMKKIKSGENEGIAPSQLAYTLSTLLNQAKQLEESFEDLAPNPQMETESTSIRYVYHHHAQDAPPRTARNPEQPGSLQSPGLRQALGQIGIGTDRNS
ncbi:MAG: hypothetical protein OXE52_05400, partial [Chloroflexi bacterium]|nr:hypothetical protein [Chloroflexota bacterium]